VLKCGGAEGWKKSVLTDTVRKRIIITWSQAGEEYPIHSTIEEV